MNLLQKKIYSCCRLSVSIGASFKDDFLKLPSKLRLPLFKELNRNYVDETNPGDLMDAIKGNALVT
jgi:carboxyl-terminal processing protease